MRVKLRFFAAVAEQLGCAGEEIELPSQVTTVAGLRAHLRSRGGAWEAALGEGRLVGAAVNLDMVKPGAAIRAGDEVAFFPPVTGG